MSEQILERAKKAILGDIQKCVAGTSVVEIKVEAHGGVEYFEQALQLPEVQAALERKNLRAQIRVIDPLSTVKEHILRAVKKVQRGAELTFQAREQDADLYYEGLALPEMKAALKRKNIKINIQVLDKHGRVKPDIVIATLDDVASGKLDGFL